MIPKSLAAFALAAAVCLMPFAAQAHHGHRHPAKEKKAKKTNGAKKGAAVIRFTVRPWA
jgi:hypothetical protein